MLASVTRFSDARESLVSVRRMIKRWIRLSSWRVKGISQGKEGLQHAPCSHGEFPLIMPASMGHAVWVTAVETHYPPEVTQHETMPSQHRKGLTCKDPWVCAEDSGHRSWSGVLRDRVWGTSNLDENRHPQLCPYLLPCLPPQDPYEGQALYTRDSPRTRCWPWPGRTAGHQAGAGGAQAAAGTAAPAGPDSGPRARCKRAK